MPSASQDTARAGQAFMMGDICIMRQRRWRVIEDEMISLESVEIVPGKVGGGIDRVMRVTTKVQEFRPTSATACGSRINGSRAR